jgi:hypothetical protein
MRYFRHAALAFLAVVGSAALSGEALAQIASGRSGMSTSDPLGNVHAFSDLRAFGICYARASRPDALMVIGTVPGSREEADLFRRRVFGEQICLFDGTRMSLSIVFMRGAIAEGLLRSGGVPENYRLPAPVAGEVHSLHDAARCYAAGHRTEVQALLETQPGSREEVAAVGALWNDFRPCITGPLVRLNAPWIRYLLAEALLRLPSAAVPAPGAN